VSAKGVAAKEHLARLDAEIENLHAALGWAVAQPSGEHAWHSFGQETAKLKPPDSGLSPARVDAPAHAATIRGIGALLAARTCE
jgi:hypothetical protein